MSSENWNRINELFYAALERAPELRDSFLKDACGSDSTLQQEVESLLAAYTDSENFIQSPASKNALEFLQHQDVQLATGDRIGAYNIVREIGRGGMGAVYLATRADERFQKSVAIKLIKRGRDTDDVLRHFRNEQQILANFDHPNIARLIDAGSTENGLPYFIMEHVEGHPIDQFCDERSLSITQRLELFQQVCAAVSYAHRNLVVHRDIKPSNILVNSAGVPKLLDFGIAKILQSETGERSTATGIHFMTPEYASPEQAQGLPVTTLSDVYSLGVLLYELLTGHSPYPLENRSALEVMRTITETQPQLPSAIINTLNAESVSKTREGSPEKLRRRLRGDLDTIVLMAMRKEPQRRYQSVDQLSEDIRRHLQGLPITARKDTFAYRTTRFVLRNRVTVAITILSLLTIALFGTVMQWRSNKQARLFQEFGQEVTRIEASMRYAYLLPLHNIQPDKKKVVDRLDYMKKRMQEMGSVAYGAGYYSLGRGYLSLHRFQDAYDNLILAWQTYQYQEPAAANALGLSLAMLYQEKLREVEQLRDKEQLNRQKAELEKRYGVPAQQYIQKGANSSEAPEYVQALLSFLAKQYPEALNKAQTAEQEISWHYESKTLQGDIFSAMANEKYRVGNISEASELYEKAKAAYLEAAKKGQSDPQIYEALCYVQSQIQEIQIDHKRKSSEEGVDEAINSCKSALQIDSKNINANLIASRIYKNWAYYQSDHGNDPSIPAEKSANFAHAALKIDSENAFAHIALGEAYSTRSNWELIRGRDPIPFLDRADVSFTKAAQKLPDDYQLLFLLANNSIKRAQDNIVNGKDPRPALEKSIEFTRKAIPLNPPHIFRYFTMLGHAYHVKGQYEFDIGLDPRDSFNKSIELSKQSITANPTYFIPYIWCGHSYLGLAFHHIQTGKDPHAALDEALKFYKSTITMDPENSYAYLGIGLVHSRKAEVLLKEGKDVTHIIKMWREAFGKTLQLDNSYTAFYYYFAEAELIAARDAVFRRKQPEPFFKELERIVRECLSINPQSAECLESSAAFHWLRTEYSASLGKSTESEMRISMKAADDSLKVTPNNGLVLAYRGKLLLIRAQSSSGAERKKLHKKRRLHLIKHSRRKQLSARNTKNIGKRQNG